MLTYTEKLERLIQGTLEAWKNEPNDAIGYETLKACFDKLKTDRDREEYITRELEDLSNTEASGCSPDKLTRAGAKALASEIALASNPSDWWAWIARIVHEECLAYADRKEVAWFGLLVHECSKVGLIVPDGIYDTRVGFDGDLEERRTDRKDCEYKGTLTSHVFTCPTADFGRAVRAQGFYYKLAPTAASAVACRHVTALDGPWEPVKGNAVALDALDAIDYFWGPLEPSTKAEPSFTDTLGRRWTRGAEQGQVIAPDGTVLLVDRWGDFAWHDGGGTLQRSTVYRGRDVLPVVLHLWPAIALDALPPTWSYLDKASNKRWIKGSGDRTVLLDDGSIYRVTADDEVFVKNHGCDFVKLGLARNVDTIGIRDAIAYFWDDRDEKSADST
jgi:hypothetical protein